MKVRLIELTDLAQSAPTRTVSTLFFNALIEEVPGATTVPNSLLNSREGLGPRGELENT
jgi:hypothetical protein